MMDTLYQMFLMIFPIAHLAFIIPVYSAISHYDELTMLIIGIYECLSIMTIFPIGDNYLLLNSVTLLMTMYYGYRVYSSIKKLKVYINHGPPLLMLSWFASLIISNFLAEHLNFPAYAYLIYYSFWHLLYCIMLYILLTRYVYRRT
jgi:hypothetical protein